MNWGRFYAAVQIWISVGCLSIFTGMFYAFIIAGLCRIAFKLEENIALLWIGGPLFAGFTIASIIYLPKQMRKVGFLSDDPKKFGPWFK